MSAELPPGGRISATRLARLLGDWRGAGSRRGTADLVAAIELQMADGRLASGTQLPAERGLATALGVSRTLVGGALATLRERGLVASRRGSGTWVASTSDGAREQSVPTGRGLIDFARASPPAVSGMLAAVEAARDQLGAELTEHGYSAQGLPVLRERIAERYRARGLPTSAAQILITNGAHHAFVLALRTLAGPGDRVLVEQPTYPNALEAIRGTYTIPTPISVADGWDVPGIAAALHQAAPRLAYLVVDFHNPTGLRLDTEGRQRLGAALRKTRTPAVVDETLAELDLESDPVDGPAPLAAFAGDWAITVGSSSKTHWGGLRIGWIRASEDLLARLVSARFAVDLGAPVFEQLVLAELLADPEATLRQRRVELRAQRDTAVEALRQYCPEWTFQIPEGGLCLWCRLPEPMSTRLAMAAVQHGVQLAPSSGFGAHGGFQRWVRLPYTHSAERLTEAIRRLSAAADSIRETGVSAPAWDPPVA